MFFSMARDKLHFPDKMLTMQKPTWFQSEKQSPNELQTANATFGEWE
jgi:hypothetical protein